MKIVCPHCNFTKDIDPAKLPPNARRATCPKCRQKFDIYGPQAGAAAPPPPKKPQPAAARPKPAQMQPPRPAAPAPPPLPQEAPPSSRAEAGTWQSQSTRQGVPWETKAGGFFGDLFATVKMVLFKPGEFFQEMPTSGGLGRPLLFAIICGSIGIIFSIFYQAAYFMLTAGMSDIFQPGMLPPEFEAFSSIPMVGVLLGLMIASPILVVFMMFIVSFFVNLFLLIVRGAGGGYEATFRTMAYVQATQLLNVVPLLGGAVSGIWGLVLIIIGLSKAHNTGVGRVIVALIVVPILLVAILGVGAAILIPILLS